MILSPECFLQPDLFIIINGTSRVLFVEMLREKSWRKQEKILTLLLRWNHCSCLVRDDHGDYPGKIKSSYWQWMWRVRKGQAIAFACNSARRTSDLPRLWNHILTTMDACINWKKFLHLKLLLEKKQKMNLLLYTVSITNSNNRNQIEVSELPVTALSSA
jgi:hypothetical protein